MNIPRSEWGIFYGLMNPTTKDYTLKNLNGKMTFIQLSNTYPYQYTEFDVPIEEIISTHPYEIIE